MTDYWTQPLLLALMLSGCASMPAPVVPLPPATRDALAPTGAVRAGIIATTSLQLSDYAPGREMKGVSIDLGQALARRAAVAFKPVPYPSITALMEGLKAGQWDVAFFAIDPSREKDVDFAAAYMAVELGYLVNGASSIRTMADVDRPGVRVAVANRGGTDIVMSRILKRAELVRADTLAAAVDLLKQGRVDALAANKPTLFAEAEHFASPRVLDGNYSTVQYAMVTPKGRPAANAFVRAFVETAKADGTVQAALDNAKLRGVIVAPRQ